MNPLERLPTDSLLISRFDDSVESPSSGSADELDSHNDSPVLLDPGEYLPVECICEVFRHITRSSDYASISRVSKRWRALQACYEMTYLTLYQNLKFVLPGAMPKRLSWNALSCDLKIGLTGGPVSWYRYNPSSRSFAVVLSTRDSAFKETPDTSKDIIVKPRVEAKSATNSQGIAVRNAEGRSVHAFKTPPALKPKQITVTCIGLSCLFPGETALTPQQQLFVEKAVKDASRDYFGESLDLSSRARGSQSL